MPLLLTLVFLALGIACLTVRLYAMKGHEGKIHLGARFFQKFKLNFNRPTDRQRHIQNETVKWNFGVLQD